MIAPKGPPEDVLEGKETLVRCDVGSGELAWEDGVRFTRAQLEAILAFGDEAE